MIDSETQERILIHTEGNGGPYLMVAHDQLGAIIETLRSHNVSHWVDEDVISIDDGPGVAVVNLGRGSEVSGIQRLLDGI